jgi:hypothetical protein
MQRLVNSCIIADRIRTGGAEVIIAGGLETMSMIPMGGHIIRPNSYLVEHYPDFYLNMGLATENVARKATAKRITCARTSPDRSEVKKPDGIILGNDTTSARKDASQLSTYVRQMLKFQAPNMESLCLCPKQPPKYTDPVAFSY